MPIYTYTCTDCNDVIERRQSFTDAPLTVCEQCGGSLRKVIHPVGIVFKGSGWYVTDSRKAASSTTAGSSSEKPSEKSSDKADSGSTASTESTSKSSATEASKPKAAASATKD